jgi:hypothetical protein
MVVPVLFHFDNRSYDMNRKSERIPRCLRRGASIVERF